MIIEDVSGSNNISYMSIDNDNNSQEITVKLYKIDDNTYDEILSNIKIEKEKGKFNVTTFFYNILNEENENCLELFFKNIKYTLKKENDYYTITINIKDARKKKLSELLKYIEKS